MRLILSAFLIIADTTSKEYVPLIDETRAMIYLMRYGYVEPHKWSDALVTEEQYTAYVNQAVVEFQAFAGLEQTGRLDNETISLMNTPRCGVRDKVGQGAHVRRRKRYVLQGSRWHQSTLTYSITRYPSSRSIMSSQQVTDTVAQAFNLWAEASGLEFQNVGDNALDADIEISFVSYEHGDGDPLDGPGGTLAHAYFPEFGGDVHMDDSENWTVDSMHGTNMLQTLTHEIGHSLGLSHSDVRNSVMAPFYQGYDPNLELKQDDIRAIQALYGPDIPKPTPQPAPTPANNDLCSNANIDAIVTTDDKETYVFRNDKYWRLTREAVATGYPRQISSDWGQGLPDNIDAAFTWQKKGATYIFKGDKYWKYYNQKPAPGYPKLMHQGFPGIPTNIDSVFVWGGNGKIYFTKGDKYWKFDPEKKPHVRDIYPRPLSLWGDLPGDLDGAFQWVNGRTYFFKSGQYWRYDDRTFSVSQSIPSYPRNTAKWWFGC